MKTWPCFTRAFLICGIAAAFVAPAAAARIDFTEIAGVYSANYTLSVAGQIVSSRAKATITVPPNGSKATLEIVGAGTVTTTPGALVALLGKHTFRANRNVSSNNSLLAMYIMLPAAPAKFSGNERRFTFQLIGGSDLIGISSMVYTVRANGKRLSIDGAGTLSGSAVTSTLRGKKLGKGR
jgi:hypothetical protein